MWRRNQICAIALLAFGLGILVGTACSSTVLTVFVGIICLCLGCMMLKRKK